MTLASHIGTAVRAWRTPQPLGRVLEIAGTVVHIAM